MQRKINNFKEDVKAVKIKMESLYTIATKLSKEAELYQADHLIFTLVENATADISAKLEQLSKLMEELC